MPGKFCPYRSVIGRLFAFSHFAIDARVGANRGERFAGKDRVDTEAAVLRKRKHPVIPPTEKIRFAMMQTKRVDKTSGA